MVAIFLLQSPGIVTMEPKLLPKLLPIFKSFNPSPFSRKATAEVYESTRAHAGKALVQLLRSRVSPQSGAEPAKGSCHGDRQYRCLCVRSTPRDCLPDGCGCVILKSPWFLPNCSSFGGGRTSSARPPNWEPQCRRDNVAYRACSSNML